MKKCLFSILDGKSGVYNDTFTAISRGVALRLFTDLVNDPKTTIARHPEDYTICEVGTFEDTTGILESHVNPVPLGNAAAFMNHAPGEVINANGKVVR